MFQTFCNPYINVWMDYLVLAICVVLYCRISLSPGHDRSNTEGFTNNTYTVKYFDNMEFMKKTKYKLEFFLLSFHLFSFSSQISIELFSYLLNIALSKQF